MDNSPRAVLSRAAPQPIGPYSQAVACGPWIFVSGQIPLDPASGEIVAGDVTVQAERVLQNLRAVLEAAGASLVSVVRTTIYLVDLSHFQAVNKVYARHFTSEPAPARSTVQVAKLPLGALVEIDAIAHRA